MKKSIDLLNDNVKRLFLSYLFPSISATLVTSIYVLADTIMIGKGIGATAIAGLNIILPLYSLFFGTGMLLGVGGSVLMSVSRGENEYKKSNEYFTTAFLMNAIMMILYLLIFFVFFDPIVTLLGSSPATREYVEGYGKWFGLGIPFFLFSSFLQAFVRNDKAPKLSMIGVIAGGVTNIILDYVFVFMVGLGMAGAAIATVIGAIVTTIILCSHFVTGHNTMRFVKPEQLIVNLRKILGNGLSSFVIEVSSGIVIFIFNLQLIRYIGDIGVSVYGIISNSAIIVMSLMNGVSQAAQPIIATNFGAKKFDRVRDVKRIGTIVALAIGVVMCLIGEFAPLMVVNIFVKPVGEILTLAPTAVRIYFASFVLIGVNIFYSNYFQSVLKPTYALLICLLRGLILSALFVYILPLFLGITGIWLVMPVGEVITFLFVLYLDKKEKKSLII